MADYIDEIIKRVGKKLGSDRVRRFSDGARSEVVEAIPTGIDVIDKYVTGCGGIPVGRLTELFGEEGSAKTALSLQTIGSCQKAGHLAVWIETEDGASHERAETFGVNIKKLILEEPETMEYALDAINETIESVDPTKGPTLLVWDSIAATSTKAEAEDGMVGNAAIGERARLLGRACRVMSGMLAEQRIAALWINQVREKIGVMFGDKLTTPGGRSVKFHSSLRLQLIGGTANKDDDGNHTGKDIIIMAVKNRFASPWRKARIRLDYAEGWDNDWTTFNYAKEKGLLPKGTRFNRENIAEIKDLLGWSFAEILADDITDLNP